MKRYILGIVMMMSCYDMIAQQQYFVFIQDPLGQPFYVRIKEESHSSSATGHIILPQLKDSVYKFFIGFPRDRYGEQLFTIAINKKDHGYELRNPGNGKYQLFDLQTLQMINPVSTQHESDQTIRKTDSYSELMAGVVNDTAVLYTSAQDTMSVDSNAVAVKTEPEVAARADLPPAQQEVAAAPRENRPPAAKVERVKADSAVKMVDSAKVVDSTAVATNGQNAMKEAQSLSNRDSRDIIRLRTENVKEGKLMIYVDRTGAVNDTIRLVIPRKL